MANPFEMIGKFQEAIDGANLAIDQFDPEWLIRAIAATAKRALLEALAKDPKLEALAARLSTDENTASVLWDAFITHLREDF